MTRNIAAATIAAILTTVSTTSASAQTPPTTGGLAMDVAGVRLGVPLASAEAALSSSFQCRRETGYQTFQQLVEAEVAKRSSGHSVFVQGSGVGDLFCKGPNGEDLRVTMAQTAAGPVVDTWNISIPTARVDQAGLLQQMQGKYGKPTTGTTANGSWCVKRCSPLLPMESGPRIDTVSLGSAFQILGTRGQLARQADEAAVKAAADRAAPPKTRGAF